MRDVAAIKTHLRRISASIDLLMAQFRVWNDCFPEEIREPLDLTELAAMRTDAELLIAELEAWQRQPTVPRGGRA